MDRISFPNGSTIKTSGLYGVDKQVLSCIAEINQQIEFMLRHCVTPVIKGEITKGKIKWRGITIELLTQSDDVTKVQLEYVLKQRGQIIKFNPLDYLFWKQKRRADKLMMTGCVVEE